LGSIHTFLEGVGEFSEGIREGRIFHRENLLLGEKFLGGRGINSTFG